MSGSYCARLMFYDILSWRAGQRKHPGLKILAAPIYVMADDPAGRIVVKKYKLKTHKGTAKRIKFTGTGVALRENAARTKYRRKKRGEIVRGLKRQTRVAAGDVGNVRRLLPYG